MSSNPPDDSWRPRRVHGALRLIWRGRDKQWHFVGQGDDEKVKDPPGPVRRHWLFLVRPAMPMLGGIIVLFLLLAGQVNYPGAGALWTLLEILDGLFIAGAFVYFLWRDFTTWFYDIDVITDKRILTWRGFLHRTRQETPLDKVQQVAVDQKTLWSILLDYGLVHVYLAGGKGLVLDKVPRPKEVGDAIERIWKAFPEKKKEPLPSLQDQAIAGAITKLSKKEAIPTLPDVDKHPKYARYYSPPKLRGPLRRFGGILRIPCDVHYDSEEYTVAYIQRSRWILALRLVLPVLMLVGLIITTFYLPFILPFAAMGVVVLIVAMGLIYVNFVDDVFILSNKRIIDIERKFIFLFEQHDTATYDKIRDIKVIMHNPIEVMLDVGDLLVETQGSENPDIKMSRIDNPMFWQDKINEIRGTKEKADKARGKNERIEELETWFTNVFSVLENSLVNRGVPNLLRLDYWTAVARAREFGMNIALAGEDASHPYIEPGKIVFQDPPPGALVHLDPEQPQSLEIRVRLSARSRPALHGPGQPPAAAGAP